MFTSIALGGGGIRGGLHVGALKAIHQVQGHLQFPKGIYGCSVGSIFATSIAFNLSLDQIQSMYDKYFSFTRMFPSFTLQNITQLSERKSLFTTESVMGGIVEGFKEHGIDLTDKLIEDSPQKLYILTSNLTTGKRALLTGKVPLLKAIECSISIPLVFPPVELYGHIHMDGGVYTRCIHDVVPNDTLVIHISNIGKAVTSSSSLYDILYASYSGVITQYHGKNIVTMKNVNLSPLSNISEEDKKKLAEEGYLQTLAFLTKRLAKEVE